MSRESIASDVTTFSAGKLEQLFGRIETCVAKLTLEQIWMRGEGHQNAIGNLILHLDGNVGQWILHGVGGRGDHRDRDREFESREQIPAGELCGSLGATVAEACAVIRALPEEEMAARISVQNYDVSKCEAILHVMEHFAGHTFQIILLTKIMTREDLGFYGHLNRKKTMAADERGSTRMGIIP